MPVKRQQGKVGRQESEGERKRYRNLKKKERKGKRNDKQRCTQRRGSKKDR